MNEKRRLLIPITIPFCIRYFIRSKALNAIKDFCEPVLLINGSNEELEKELAEKGIEFYHFPKSTFGKLFDFITKLNGFKYGRKIESVSTDIDIRRNNFLWMQDKALTKKKKINSILNIASYAVPGTLLNLFENNYVEKTSNLHAIKQTAKTWRIDMVLTLTPFLKDEFLLLKAFKALKVPIVYSVLSFDNLTTRGYLPVKFDHFYVWNQLNKNEVLRIFGNSQPVDIVGPVQFDFYWDPTYLWDKEKWKSELGIITDRQIILFGAGLPNIVPNEHQYLLDIDRAISANEIKGNPIILLRPHPLDNLVRWQSILDQCNNVIVDNSCESGSAKQRTSRFANYDITRLCSTLKWTDVHVNASSTMTLDGAIFDKPQVGPAYATGDCELAVILNELYYREHYLPITESGGLQVAYSNEQLTSYINEAFSSPGKLAQQRKDMVDIYCGNEHGGAAERLAMALKNLLN